MRLARMQIDRKGEPLVKISLKRALKLRKELEFLERKADPRLAREVRGKWKAIEKEMRHHRKRQG